MRGWEIDKQQEKFKRSRRRRGIRLTKEEMETRKLVKSWFDDMKNVFEIYEVTTPRFTVPNPCLPSPRLPLEIFNLMLDAGDDLSSPDSDTWKDTLSRCCLTCHALLPFSRRSLCGNLIFQDAKRFNYFLDGLAQWSHLQPNVRSIWLCLSDDTAFMQLLLRGSDILPNLHSLRLQSTPGELSQSLLDDVSHPFENISSLRFQSARFSSVMDLRKLTENFFPHITLLQLNQVFISSPHYIAPTMPLKKESLQKLALSTLDLRWISEFRIFDKWFCSSHGLLISSLRNLRISAKYLDLLPHYGEFLQVLVIDWADLHDQTNDQSCRNMSLDSNILPSLQTLQLEGFGRGGIHSIPTCYNLLLQTKNPSSSLTCIQFLLDGFSYIGSFDLLDTLLSSGNSRFGRNWNLRRVEVQDEDYMGHFPKVHEKGLLFENQAITWYFI
ncbi:hypothetical protein ABKN59_011750 [Abortiporus biennis]